LYVRPEVVRLALLDQGERLLGQVGAELVEVAELVVVAPDPTPTLALLPLLRRNLGESCAVALLWTLGAASNPAAPAAVSPSAAALARNPLRVR
jgi:hypothetical protein